MTWDMCSQVMWRMCNLVMLSLVMLHLVMLSCWVLQFSSGRYVSCSVIVNCKRGDVIGYSLLPCTIQSIAPTHTAEFSRPAPPPRCVRCVTPRCVRPRCVTPCCVTPPLRDTPLRDTPLRDTPLCVMKGKGRIVEIGVFKYTKPMFDYLDY